LPSIQQLATDAWELFKKTWVFYLKLLGLSFAYIFLVVLVGILISLPITFVAIGSGLRFFNHMTPFHYATLILFILWIIFFIVSVISVEIIVPIAGIFILQGKRTTPIFDLLKSTKPFFWQYFLTMLICGFLSVGGMFLVIIPGFLIAFFFIFVMYEIVLEKQKGLAALKRSYFMVKSHFWEVLGRFVVLEVVYLIILGILTKLAAGDALLGLVRFLYILFFSWYAWAYMFLLYKEVKARTTFPEKISITWIWIVSVIGWLLLVLLFVSLIIGLAHLPMQLGPIHRVSPNAV